MAEFEVGDQVSMIEDTNPTPGVYTIVAVPEGLSTTYEVVRPDGQTRRSAEAKLQLVRMARRRDPSLSPDQQVCLSRPTIKLKDGTPPIVSADVSHVAPSGLVIEGGKSHQRRLIPWTFIAEIIEGDA